MYSFKKVKSENTNHQQFSNVNFHRDYPECMVNIKRRQIKKIEFNRKKKVIDIETLTKEANFINDILSDITTKVNTTDKEVNFLELLQKELMTRNIKLRQQISSLNDQEKNLEKYLLLTISNFAPGLFKKGN